VDRAAWNILHLSIGSPFTLTDLHSTINFVAVGEVNYIPTVNDSAEASGTGDYVASGGVLVDYRSYASISKIIDGTALTRTPPGCVPPATRHPWHLCAML